jgi:hypothetical protein
MTKFKVRQYVFATIYLIDGVRVPKHVFEARQIFGEHPAARFEAVEVRRLK